jgi:hypothetical protein
MSSGFAFEEIDRALADAPGRTNGHAGGGREEWP